MNITAADREAMGEALFCEVVSVLGYCFDAEETRQRIEDVCLLEDSLRAGLGGYHDVIRVYGVVKIGDDFDPGRRAGFYHMFYSKRWGCTRVHEWGPGPFDTGEDALAVQWEPADPAIDPLPGT